MNTRGHNAITAIRATVVALLLGIGIAAVHVPVGSAAAPAGARAAQPLHAVDGVAPGQAGYVHYFLLRMPDESLEVQVGVELADQRIAWSFPDLGVTVSPFIDAGAVEADGRVYEVWHLYGLRPFPDDAAMMQLRRELPARVDRWLRTDLPYCLDDGPRAQCISCLGFVMRALFPGRSRNGYPDIPADFSYARSDNRYTPNDLLLYLSGMLDLPGRSARLQRLNQQSTLPQDLREDLEELVHAMTPGDTRTPATAAPLTSRQKKVSATPLRKGKPQVLRKKP